MRIAILTFAIFFFGCVHSIEGRATSSMHRATVKQSGSLPCFALDGSRVVRRNPSQIVMVHVSVPESTPMAGDGQVAWSLGLPPGATLLVRSDECVPYGVEPDNADVMVPPSRLHTGVAYSVSLNTDVLLRRGVRNRVYSGDFCLSTRADGSILVHDLWTSNGDVPEGGPCRDLYHPGR